MKNKKAIKILGLSLAASVLTGCNNFNPADETVTEVYGPPVVMERPIDEARDTKDKIEEIYESIDPSDEQITCDYGVMIPEDFN